MKLSLKVEKGPLNPSFLDVIGISGAYAYLSGYTGCINFRSASIGHETKTEDLTGDQQ